MPEADILDEISRKLSLLITVTLLPEPKSLSTKELVGLIDKFGISNKEIADILGTTKGSVEVLKSRIKKGKRG